MAVTVPEEAGADTGLEQQEWPFVDELMRVYAGLWKRESFWGMLMATCAFWTRRGKRNGAIL